MKRRGWTYDRGQNTNPFWICVISATLIFMIKNIDAKNVHPSTSNIQINKISKIDRDVPHKAESPNIKTNDTEPKVVKSNEREYKYLTENVPNEINQDEYYYYYEDVIYDDVGEEIYHLESAKDNKTNEKEKTKSSAGKNVNDEDLQVIINVDNGESIRKERDSHLGTHIIPHGHPTSNQFEQPEVYSTGWVVIPQPLPAPGNYVHQSTTPAPHDLHIKHHNIHHHDPHHPSSEIAPLIPVTTIATITTTEHALPTPTQHLPFHNFPKYHKHKTHYVPKNVYVQDSPYDTVLVTEPTVIHTIETVNDIPVPTHVKVEHHHDNIVSDSRAKEAKKINHKVLDEIYHFHPHPALPPPAKKYLVPPTHPTPSYHFTPTTTQQPVTTALPSYLSHHHHHHPQEPSNHIHYNHHVRYPETTTTTTPNPNEHAKRPQRNYFPAPRIIGVLEDEGATTLLDLIEKANLTDILSDRDSTFTIFAPTNEAFAKLDPNLIRTLTDDDDGDFDLLRSVLLYHVVPRKIYSRNFNDDTTLETALVIDSDDDDNTNSDEEEGSGDEEKPQENRQLRVTKNKDNKIVTINGAHVDIKNSDQTASNGVVHFLKDVIYPIPTGTIFETLSSDNRFSILVDLLEAAELAPALNTSSADALTIFAPTDDAFLKLPRSGLEEIVEDKQQVTDLLFSHVTMSTKLSPDLTFVTLKSLTRGKDINIQVRKGQVYVGDGKLIDGDIITTNGAIQVIDTVLL